MSVILSTDGLHRGPIFLDYFHKPNAAEIGTMVAILEVGAFISSLVVGRLGDIIGRRRTILYGSLIFVSLALVQCRTASLPKPLQEVMIQGVVESMPLCNSSLFSRTNTWNSSLEGPSRRSLQL